MLHRTYQEDPEFHIKPIYMSDAALGEMYSARPVVSSDAIFCQRATRSVFLTDRKFRPAEGLWVVGGARKAGETAVETIVRKVKDETSLEIAPERFSPLGVIEYIWRRRFLPPEDEGRHDINWVFGLEVTDDELAQAGANLDPNEYNAESGLRKFSSITELVDAGARPIIIDYYKELFS